MDGLISVSDAIATPISARRRRENRALRPVPHGDAGQHTEHHRRHRGGQFGEPGLQRAVPLDELEELGQEEEHARKAQHR